MSSVTVTVSAPRPMRWHSQRNRPKGNVSREDESRSSTRSRSCGMDSEGSSRRARSDSLRPKRLAPTLSVLWREVRSTWTMSVAMRLLPSSAPQNTNASAMAPGSLIMQPSPSRISRREVLARRSVSASTTAAPSDSSRFSRLSACTVALPSKKGRSSTTPASVNPLPPSCRALRLEATDSTSSTCFTSASVRSQSYRSSDVNDSHASTVAIICRKLPCVR
mmetsp:Transcript_17120/g.54995  ORF Transcript_17120/g.54995 Transcript_17120/m.54995 type:complete len:221 (+) Transcript_17120:2153-2815(+)